MRAALLATLAVSFPDPSSAQQPGRTGRISGRVVDAVTGRPLRAEVIVSPIRQKAMSDSNGRFLFGAIAPGAYVVGARALGYAPLTIPSDVGESGEAEVTLRLRTATVALRALATVVPGTERDRFENLPAPSVSSIASAELSRLPVIGDRDIVRAATLLPGVAARNDFSAGINVRGGEADQNLVLLDGVPIYNPFHLGGLFGTFIDAAVRQVDVFTGGFPAQYGGRLSSVLDVKSAEDARPGVHATTDVSFLASSARLSGSVDSARVSWSVAARRSYADRLVNAVVGSNDFPYHFQDLQLHGLAHLPRGGTLALTGYASRDELRTVTGSESSLVPGSGGAGVSFDWGNRAAGVALTQPLGARTTFAQRLSVSGFATHFDIAADSQSLSQRLREDRVAGRLGHVRGGHEMAVGYEASRYRSTYRERLTGGAGTVLGDGASGVGDSASRQQTSAVSLFVEDSWRANSRLHVRPGVRAEWVPAAGWSGVSPRVSAKLFLNDALALTFAAGRYAQWMRAIRNEDLPIRVFDLWVASDSVVPVSSSTHLVLGLERWLGSSRFVRLEGYGKRYDRLLEQASTVDPRIRASLLREFGGTSYGVDLYARQLERHGFGGWLSYSYGVSAREFQGERYFPAHDRRHNGTVALSFAPGRHYTFGAHVAVASGTPYTGWAGYMQRWLYDPVTSQWTPAAATNVEDHVVRGRRNGDRLPLYSRVDLSVERHFRLGRASLRPHLSLVNVLNRDNVLLYSLDASSDPAAIRRFSQFPLLPSLGLRAEF